MKFDIENHEKTHHGYLELTSSPPHGVGFENA